MLEGNIFYFRSVSIIEQILEVRCNLINAGPVKPDFASRLQVQCAFLLLIWEIAACCDHLRHLRELTVKEMIFKSAQMKLDSFFKPCPSSSATTSKDSGPSSSLILTLIYNKYCVCINTTVC
jgi:hypothetical protein